MSAAFHPAVVHFPIALLLVNFALTLWLLRRYDSRLEHTAYLCLALGWLGAFAAIVTGTIAVALEWPLDAATLGWLNAHALSGFALLIVYGQALLRRRRDPGILRSPRRRSYLALLALGALLVVVSGWIGGQLVYTFGLGVR